MPKFFSFNRDQLWIHTDSEVHIWRFTWNNKKYTTTIVNKVLILPQQIKINVRTPDKTTKVKLGQNIAARAKTDEHQILKFIDKELSEKYEYDENQIVLFGDNMVINPK